MYVKLKLKPFATPNFVAIDRDTTDPKWSVEDQRGPSSVAIGELDYAALDELCKDFRRSIFLKAGKPDTPPSN